MARPGRLELPTLCLEGSCSLHLSYGRVGCIDSKSFMATSDSILEALTLCRMGRRSIQLFSGCRIQQLFRHERTAASSTPPPSTLGPFDPGTTFRNEFQSQP